MGKHRAPTDHQPNPQPPHTEMNKAELIDAVHEALGDKTTRAEASDAVDAVVEAIIDGVKKKGVVRLVGFGTFKLAHRKARMGRNPSTREPAEIKASNTVRFTCSELLRAKL